jgi:hypothetical protein
MRLFDQALEIDPENLPARLSRAEANIAQGKFTAVDQDLDPTLQTAPDRRRCRSPGNPRATLPSRELGRPRRHAAGRAYRPALKRGCRIFLHRRLPCGSQIVGERLGCPRRFKCRDG